MGRNDKFQVGSKSLLNGSAILEDVIGSDLRQVVSYDNRRHVFPPSLEASKTRNRDVESRAKVASSSVLRQSCFRDKNEVMETHRESRQSDSAIALLRSTNAGADRR